MVARRLTTALLFSVLCAVAFLPSAAAAEAPRPRTIAVFGSSVAHGSGDHENKGGYAGRLGDLLQPRGWEVVNVSKGGDNTISIAPRFEADLLPAQAGYVIIGLSLSNEGIAKRKDTPYRERIYAQWRTGIRGLIEQCREAGMKVVVANCYAHTQFAANPSLYEYTRRMDVEISRWDVPSINLLGAIDDGRGAWMHRFQADDGHPNGSGHREMFHAIVPSLFEAIEAGKPTPVRETGNGYAHVKGGDQVVAPLSFMPEDPMHAFAMSFWVHTATDGVLAAFTGKAATLRREEGRRRKAGKLEADVIEVDGRAVTGTLTYRDGRIGYTAADGSELSAPVVMDGAWRHVALSHWCARGVTELYVDGTLIGTIPERMFPETFRLGGGATPQPAAKADVKEWTIYRAALNPDAVRYIHEGDLYQSSLEVYAPLTDKAFTQGTGVENRAQSLSRVKVVEDGLAVGTP